MGNVGWRLLLPANSWLVVTVKVCGSPTSLMSLPWIATVAPHSGKDAWAKSINTASIDGEERVSARKFEKHGAIPLFSALTLTPPSMNADIGYVPFVVPGPLGSYDQGTPVTVDVFTTAQAFAVSQLPAPKNTSFRVPSLSLQPTFAAERLEGQVPCPASGATPTAHCQTCTPGTAPPFVNSLSTRVSPFS